MKTKNLIKTALFALLMFVANIVQAQNTISGSVSDADNGEAIPGANVIVIGSNTGGATDFDGNFEFPQKEGKPLTIERRTSCVASFASASFPVNFLHREKIMS